MNGMNEIDRKGGQFREENILQRESFYLIASFAKYLIFISLRKLVICIYLHFKDELLLPILAKGGKPVISPVLMEKIQILAQCMNYTKSGPVCEV